jgi:hypothetical protein
MQTPCVVFLKTSAWYRVPGPGYLAPGTRDPVPDQRRRPDTEHREPSLGAWHLGTRYPVPETCVQYTVAIVL